MGMMLRCGSRWWCVVGVVAAVTLVLVAAARPAVSASPTVQLGLASWYGPGFHGEETASGEIFDQREMVAAHRSLPLGSVVRVTNLQGGAAAWLRPRRSGQGARGGAAVRGETGR